MQKCKRTRDPDTNNKNIQPEYRNGIWHWKMCLAHNEKWEKRNNWKNRTTNQESITMLGEKENYKYLGMLEADTIKQAEIKEKSL